MKTIKLGIFGSGRGGHLMESVLLNNGEVVAICDKNSAILKEAAEKLGKDVATYSDFDAFIEHDMDAVLLTNFFHEHAPFAIRCLEKGIHVLSECSSNGTMAEGVELVRAAEKSNAIYMLAENYPFMQFNQEMRRVYRSGTLGKVLYAEGEYNHPVDGNDAQTYRSLKNYSKHWRNFLPRSYYITHSLAPLMYITGSTPRRVTAFGVFAPETEYDAISSMTGDRAAIVTCLNDDDSVFRVTGCAAFGAHHNSYRVCGTRGQIENIRGEHGKVMLRYNAWQVPEGREKYNHYMPEWPEGDAALLEKIGHGGGDYFVIKEFFDCIRENRRPEFDVYFATTCASVAILAHRSVLAGGVPFDVPDFRNEADRVKYENDRTTPFYGADGSAPNIPCSSHPDYRPDEEKFNHYLEMIGEK